MTCPIASKYEAFARKQLGLLRSKQFSAAEHNAANLVANVDWITCAVCEVCKPESPRDTLVDRVEAHSSGSYVAVPVYGSAK